MRLYAIISLPLGLQLYPKPATPDIIPAKADQALVSVMPQLDIMNRQRLKVETNDKISKMPCPGSLRLSPKRNKEITYAWKIGLFVVRPCLNACDRCYDTLLDDYCDILRMVLHKLQFFSDDHYSLSSLLYSVYVAKEE